GGARLQYFPLSVLVASYLTYRRCGEEGRGVWRPWAAIVGPIVLVTGLFYVPVWIQHHVTLRWIEASRPTQQGLFGLLARLIYKGTYAVGLVAYVSAGVGIVLEWDRWSALELDDVLESKPVVVGLIVIAYHIVLFGYAPIDPAYLLAGIIFGGVVLSALNMRTTIAMLAAGQLVSAVVTVDVLEIQHKQTGLCKPTNATGASPTLTVERGPVLREFDKLEQQRKCYREMLEVPYSHHMEPLPPDEHGREERQ
ncbi:MAG: hypothetical protein ABEL76_14360, partial [Bradymonadaceae bacterium]